MTRGFVRISLIVLRYSPTAHALNDRSVSIDDANGSSEVRLIPHDPPLEIEKYSKRFRLPLSRHALAFHDDIVVVAAIIVALTFGRRISEASNSRRRAFLFLLFLRSFGLYENGRRVRGASFFASADRDSESSIP